MALLLNIETSGTNCSVAISRDGTIVSHKELDDGYTHSEHLHSFIVEVLEKANVSLKDINGVAVSAGPGSYTGLRIGVSAAKGICFAKKIPLIAVDTLEALCYAPQLESASIGSNDVLCPMIDARRMEVYYALLNNHKKVISKSAPKIIDNTSFSDLSLSGKLILFGDGSNKCKAVLKENSSVKFIDNVIASATNMASIANKKFISKEFEDLAYFEPSYLKPYMGAL